MIFIYYCYFLHISCLHRWPDDWCWEEQHCQHVVQTWFSSVTALHFIPMHLYGDHMTTWETVPEFRQFFWLFWTLVSDFFMVSTIAMETLDPTTMRSIIHEQTSGEQFFSYFEPRKWCFPGIYYRNGDIGPNDNAEHHPRADKRRAFFFAILNPVSDVFLATTIAMEKFSRPNDDAEHRPRAAKQRCPSRVAASQSFFSILNPCIKVMFSWHLLTQWRPWDRVEC